MTKNRCCKDLVCQRNRSLIFASWLVVIIVTKLMESCVSFFPNSGMNAEKALKLIQEFKTIDVVLGKIDREKHPISESWLSQYPKARLQFIEPNVTVIADDELKTKTFDYEKFESYLVTDLGFSRQRVKNILKRIENSTLSPKKPDSTKRSMQSTSSTNRRTRHNTGGNTISTNSRKLTEFFKPVEEGTGEGESSKRSEP